MRAHRQVDARRRTRGDLAAVLRPAVARDRAVAVVGTRAVEAHALAAAVVGIRHRLVGARVGRRGHVRRFLHGDADRVGRRRAVVVAHRQRDRVRAHRQVDARRRTRGDLAAVLRPAVARDRAVAVVGTRAVEAHTLAAAVVGIRHRLVGARIGRRGHVAAGADIHIGDDGFTQGSVLVRSDREADQDGIAHRDGHAARFGPARPVFAVVAGEGVAAALHAHPAGRIEAGSGGGIGTAAGAGPALERHALAGGLDHHRVDAVCVEAGTEHHARLGPLVGIGQALDTGGDGAIAAELLVHEVEFIALVPDVIARTLNGEGAGAVSGVAGSGDVADILTRPGAGQVGRRRVDGDGHAVGRRRAVVVAHRQRDRVRAHRQVDARRRTRGDLAAVLRPAVARDRAVAVVGTRAVEAHALAAAVVGIRHRLVGARVGRRSGVGTGAQLALGRPGAAGRVTRIGRQHHLVDDGAIFAHPDAEGVLSGAVDIDAHRAAASLVLPMPGAAVVGHAVAAVAGRRAIETGVERIIGVRRPDHTHPDVVGTGGGEIDGVVETRAIGAVASVHSRIGGGFERGRTAIAR